MQKMIKVLYYLYLYVMIYKSEVFYYRQYGALFFSSSAFFKFIA